MAVTELDRRMMAAAIRYSYRHLSRTGTNPSVSTLIVREIDGDMRIVGRGLTALGGRPHAETEAIGEAGDLARGATAYVSLEPCSHHGSTPPCAEGLIKAGIKRVVAATTDPDDRVSGRGYRMLREAGVEVEEGVMEPEAQYALAGYLTRRTKNRPLVTLKLALSADGRIGRRGAGQVHITGPVAGAMNHVARAAADAILVGIGTVIEDDPMLTCRLPRLENRSPIRIVLDRDLRLPLDSKLVQSATKVPLIVATTVGPGDERFERLQQTGARLIACDSDTRGIALPELLDDLTGQGLSTLIVEGGAAVARSFLEDELVDRIDLFEGPETIGADGVDAPIGANRLPDGFELTETRQLGKDLRRHYERTS